MTRHCWVTPLWSCDCSKTGRTDCDSDSDTRTPVQILQPRLVCPQILLITAISYTHDTDDVMLGGPESVVIRGREMACAVNN